MPAIISTASLRGILEARQRFDLVNYLRVPLGVFTFAGPLLVLPFAQTLTAAVLVLVAGRYAAWVAHYVLCRRVVPAAGGAWTLDRRYVRQLLRFGGWMTVSNVISPILVYLDRFLIGALLTAQQVAYYATPWEVVTKLLLVPAALSSVLFPGFGYWHRRDPVRVRRLYVSGVKLSALALFPPVLLAILASRPALLYWLGPDYAAGSTLTLQILAVGTLLNGVATIPFALVQGVGRPDLSAKLHAAEFVLYVPVLWLLLSTYGIAGAAVAWSLRTGADLVLLLRAGGAFVRPDEAERRTLVAGLGAGTALCVLAVAFGHGLPAAVVFLAAGGALFAAGWRHFLGESDRLFLKRLAARYLP